MYWVLFYLQNLFRTNKNKFDFNSFYYFQKAFGVLYNYLLICYLWDFLLDRGVKTVYH